MLMSHGKVSKHYLVSKNKNRSIVLQSLKFLNKFSWTIVSKLYDQHLFKSAVASLVTLFKWGVLQRRETLSLGPRPGKTAQKPLKNRSNLA